MVSATRGVACMGKLFVFDFKWTIFEPETNTLYDGVTDLLATLKQDHKLVLITQAGENLEARKEEVKKLGIEQFFDTIKIIRKKDIGVYKDILAEFNIESGNVFVVDDKVTAGITFGNTLGMNTIWVRQGKNKNLLPTQKTEEAKHIIESLSELHALLEELKL
jgi:HAD superfamily hydrolase (TIGR01509 family)